MAGKVKLYDAADDRVIVAEAAEVPELLEQGLELETAGAAKRREYEKTAGAGEALKTVGENLASGATLGLSDVALSAALGDDYREGRELRDETFSGLAGVSQVVGGVAPALLSGGTGLVAEAAALTPTALAARAGLAAERVVARAGGRAFEGSLLREAAGGAARFGAAGVVEGALAGTGAALSEAMLESEVGSYESLAERAWAGARSGAIFGLVGGAALGGVANAAVGSSRRLAGRFAQTGDELAEAANERAFKVMSPRFNDARKLGVEKIQQIGEDIRNYTLRDGSPLLEALDNTESFAPKMAQARREVTEELGALRAKVAADPTPVDAGEFLRRVDNEVLAPLLASPSPTIRRQGERAAAELASLRDRVNTPAMVGPNGQVAVSAPPVTYAELLEQQKALKTVVYGNSPKAGGVKLAHESEEHLQRIERVLEESLEGHVEATLQRISPDDVGRYADTKRLAESFIKADDLMRKTNPQNKGNRFLSLTDYMSGLGSAGPAIGAVVGGAPGAALGAVGNIALSFAHKQIRERGSALLATLYTRSRAADTAMTSRFGQFFRQARQAVRTAAVAGGGVAAGEGVAYDVRRALRAQRDETPEQAYDRVVARASDVVQGRALGPYVLDDHAPRTSQAMRAVQLRAAQHLVKNAPVPPQRTSNPNLGALTQQSKPDPTALYEFSRRVAAIENPMSILDDLHRGTLSVAATEAVREVYPQLYAEMQSRVLEGLAGSKELLPYEHRIRLGVLFELPTDPTLRPEYIAAIQQSYAPAQPVTPKALPASAGSRSKQLTSLAQDLETEAEA
jgi:hypothetical protein